MLKPEVEEWFKGLLKLSHFETEKSRKLRNTEKASCTCPKVADVLIQKAIMCFVVIA